MPIVYTQPQASIFFVLPTQWERPTDFYLGTLSMQEAAFAGEAVLVIC